MKTINLPTTPGQNARGKNGARVVSVPDRIGTNTSPAANFADEAISILVFLCILWVFSITTIASSTTIPIARTIPRSVKTLMEKSTMYIIKNAPISDMGIAITGITVVRQSLRKRKIIRTTSPNAINIDKSQILSFTKYYPDIN